MAGNILEERSCLFCSRKTRDGLFILGYFICRRCETMLVSTPVGSLDYMAAVELINQIWQKSRARVAEEP